MDPHRKYTGFLYIRVAGTWENAGYIDNLEKLDPEKLHPKDVEVCASRSIAESIRIILYYDAKAVALLDWEGWLVIEHYSHGGDPIAWLKQRTDKLDFAGGFITGGLLLEYGGDVTFYGSPSIRFSQNGVHVGQYHFKYKDLDCVGDGYFPDCTFWVPAEQDPNQPLLTELCNDLDFILANSPLAYISRWQFKTVAGNWLLDSILDQIETMSGESRQKIICDQNELNKALRSPLRQPGVQF